MVVKQTNEKNAKSYTYKFKIIIFNQKYLCMW